MLGSVCAAMGAPSSRWNQGSRGPPDRWPAQVRIRTRLLRASVGPTTRLDTTRSRDMFLSVRGERSGVGVVEGGQPRELDPRADAELEIDAPKVSADGVVRHEQPGGGLAVGEPVRGQTGDCHLR